MQKSRNRFFSYRRYNKNKKPNIHLTFNNELKNK